MKLSFTVGEWLAAPVFLNKNPTHDLITIKNDRIPFNIKIF